MKRTIIITLAACGLCTVAAAEAPASPEAMRDRIRQGVRSGSLTGPEAARIRQQQAQLRRQVARSQATGQGVNPAERARILANARQNSRLLYRLKHNNRSR